jgi:hypothetical protein
VAEISRSQLEKAEKHLSSIAGNPSGLRNRDIDWQVIKTELSHLESAVEQGNVTDFDEAFERLKARLPEPQVVRGKIGPAPKNEPPVMPPPVFDLLNHVVHKLHLKQDESPKSQQSESTKQSK